MHASIAKVPLADLFTEARTHHAWQQLGLSGYPSIEQRYAELHLEVADCICNGGGRAIQASSRCREAAFFNHGNKYAKLLESRDAGLGHTEFPKKSPSARCRIEENAQRTVACSIDRRPLKL